MVQTHKELVVKLLNTEYVGSYFFSEERGVIFAGTPLAFFQNEKDDTGKMVSATDPTFSWLISGWSKNRHMRHLEYLFDLEEVPVSSKEDGKLSIGLQMGTLHLFKNKESFLLYLQQKGKGSIAQIL